MKQKIAVPIVIILLLTLINCSLTAQVASVKQRTVVLDAGHGGKDTGAIGLKSREKDIVLSIVLKVGSYIQQNMPNVRVIYTRDADFFPTLDHRADIANKNNADLFVSIHANSTKNSKAFGTETFAMGLHKSQGNLEVAQKENSVIVLEKDYNTRYEGFDPNSAESYIIFSMMQNVFLDKSLKLASMIETEFSERAKRFDRGVKQAGFLVLWHTKMPSVLVETGFISNPDEEAYLMSEEGQEYLSSAIYRAIKNFIEQIDMEDNEINLNIASKKNEDIQHDSIKVVYRIQVTSSTNKIEEPDIFFGNFTDVFEFLEGNTYKYALGSFQTLNDVKDFQKTVKKEYPDAFIVAFCQGKKISLDDAKKIENKTH
jgi:N-acetylmuramoyl-L-alanine amidase